MPAPRLPAVVAGLALAGAIAAVAPATAADPTATVVGRVVAQGRPIADGRVILHFDAGDQFVGAYVTKDGLYKIDRVPPGQYRITVEGKGVREKYASRERS